MTAVDTPTDTRTVLAEPFQTDVIVKGTGPALVYLHSQYGLRWNDYLEQLSQSFTVYAPQVAGEEATLERLDDMLDLLTYLNDVLDALGLGSTAVVGHSLGGALAAELAAINPNRVSSLVLLSPLGIWSDADPTPDIIGETPADRAARLFVDPASDAGQEWVAGLMSTDRVYFKGMRGYTHWYWPLNEAGLRKRAHRVVAPTLVVHGAADGLTTQRYAETLAAMLPNATVAPVADASHMLSEKASEVAALTIAHLQS
ncbi:MAG TPA: alpha/beta hydrolase [Ilumatobacteraceae bacterium]|nr:alpha/beta hydrolase [Ilumatobacteraceae bacterium]